VTNQFSKQAVSVVLLVMAFGFAGIGQTRTGGDFEALLGLDVFSPLVQQFVRTNHLNWSSGLPDRGGYDSTNSPFMLFWCSNRIYMVSVALDTVRFEPNTYPGYSGKMPYGLTHGDTPDSVIERLGAPTRQRTLAGGRLIEQDYNKLRLQLDFDGKSRRLIGVTWHEKMPKPPN
jgi:hypothetical protein